MDIATIKEITVLPQGQIVFVKRIYLENDYFSGVVAYTRNLTDRYKMIPKKRSKEELYLYHYGEDEYPSDELDRIILDLIRQKYPDAECRTSFQLCNTDLEGNLRWKEQRVCETIDVRVELVQPVSVPCSIEPIDGPVEQFPLPLEAYSIRGVANRKPFNIDLLYPVRDIKKYDEVKECIIKTYHPYGQIIK